MADALEVVFRSFWTWLGTLAIVAALAEGIGGALRVRYVRRIVSEEI